MFYGDYLHHTLSLDLFIRFDKTTGCCAAHSLAEVCSTLPRMPGRHRISGERAMLFIGGIPERLSLIALTGNEYAGALEACSAPGSWTVSLSRLTSTARINREGVEERGGSAPRVGILLHAARPAEAIRQWESALAPGPGAGTCWKPWTGAITSVEELSGNRDSGSLR